MPKRTNEQSQSEPAAKRVANSSSHQDLLVEAQASLDRLDFKTTEAICSQIIDSNPKDVHHPLLMRSISLGKRNRPYEAVQDVERALNSKKSVETHLRAAFAYLGIVQHHLNLAKGHFVEGHEPTTSLSCRNVIELEESIQEAKDLEKRGSFKRVSPELFIKIVSFCDSPSLMKVRVSKQFNQSILGDEELFRSFTMRGTSAQILRGLMAFNGRCNSTVHSVKLEVLNEFRYDLKARVSMQILASSATLRSLESADQGDMGQHLLSIAHCCPLLKVFSTSRLDSTDKFHNSTFDLQPYTINLNLWRVKQLETFIVTCGSFRLHCDDNLLSVLQRAKVVKMSEDGVNQSWIIKLLSSTPSLVEVEIPFQSELNFENEVELESIELPHFNLPSLTLLKLARIPLEASCQLESQFLEKLVAPFLQELSLGEVRNLAHLRFLKSSPQICSFAMGVSNLRDYHDTAASTLLKSIQGWERLQNLSIRVNGALGSEFRDSLVSFLTPQSKENILSEWKEILLLPQLNSLAFDGEDEDSGDADLVSLACLCSARKAIYERLPLEVVLWRANGNFEADQQASISCRNLVFKAGTPQICSPIQSLFLDEMGGKPLNDTNTSKALEWLRENLSHFRQPFLVRILDPDE